MKHTISTLIILLIFIISVRADNVSNLEKDLNSLVGENYYIFNFENNDATIIIKKRFSVDILGNVKVYEYSPDFMNFIQRNFSQKYPYKFTFELQPDVPPYQIDEEIKKKRLGTLLLSALIGVISLYIGFIIFRIIKTRREGQKYI